MSLDLNLSDVIQWRDQTWRVLEARYPYDETLALLKRLERQAEALAKNQGFASDPDGSAELGDISERIATASIELFKGKFTEPVFCRDIVIELKKQRIPLPADAAKASASVAGVFAKRSKIFRRFAGRTAKAASKWHLQSNV